MKRKFLFEILEDIANAPTIKEGLIKELDESREFREFVEIIFCSKYNWECSKEVYETKARNLRERGGYPSGWWEALRVIKRDLVHTTQYSPRFVSHYRKACSGCNKKDVDILNKALKYRCLSGFKKRDIIKHIKEYFGDEYESI